MSPTPEEQQTFRRLLNQEDTSQLSILLLLFKDLCNQESRIDPNYDIYNDGRVYIKRKDGHVQRHPRLDELDGDPQD